jgi:hypothetical protein
VISFRYHVVTIVAVFLALGIGVVVGTTAVKPSVINELTNRTDELRSTANQLRDQLAKQNQDLRTWDAFATSVRPLLIQGRLTERPIVLVATQDGDPAELDGVREALRDAGADVRAVLVVTARMGLPDAGSRTALAEVLGLPPTLPPSELSKQAGGRLASRLAEGPGVDPDADLLRLLVAANFVQVQPRAAIDTVGGLDQAAVVLSGGQTALVPRPGDFYIPLVTSLVQATYPVAAVETADDVNGFVSLVRRDGTLDTGVLTVDNVDSLPGEIALVLGMADLLGPGLGSCGDFGVKAGACSPLPRPSPSP